MLKRKSDIVSEKSPAVIFRTKSSLTNIKDLYTERKEKQKKIDLLQDTTKLKETVFQETLNLKSRKVIMSLLSPKEGIGRSDGLI